MYIPCCFFFKQKTAYEMRISDWSSDVCSSDLAAYIAALEKLVAYYPKPNYWLDLITRTANKPGFSTRLTLDLYRLKKQTDTLTKANDSMEAAQIGRASCRERVCQYV